MSDTPETDRIARILENLDEWIDDSLRKSKPIGLTLCAARSTIADHRARITEMWDALETLRRERDEAREVASGLSIQEERVNEAQKELSSIHRWIDKNHADGFIDSLTYFQNLERVTDNWYDRLDRLEVDAKRFVRERDEAREALRELWQTADAYIPQIDEEQTTKWHNAMALHTTLQKVK